MTRLAKGPSLMPWYLFVAILALSAYGIGSMIHEYRRLGRERSEADDLEGT
jgi:hypothetical protein